MRQSGYVIFAKNWYELAACAGRQAEAAYNRLASLEREFEGSDKMEAQNFRDIHHLERLQFQAGMLDLRARQAEAEAE